MIRLDVFVGFLVFLFILSVIFKLVYKGGYLSSLSLDF